MKKFKIILLSILIAILLSWLFAGQNFGISKSQAQNTVTINVTDNIVGTKKNVALNVNPYNISFEHAYWSANMVGNPSFESDWFGSKTSGTITTSGGDWVIQGRYSDPIPAGNVMATVDYNEKVSGASSQKISINPTLGMDIELVNYQKPVAIPGHTYRAKMQIKGNTGGQVKIVIGTTDVGEIRSSSFNINNNWQTLSFDYIPDSAVIMQSVLLVISAKGDIWVDDFIFWDVTDTDNNGLSQSLINRMKEVKPSMLRWGSLYVNDISLPRATFRPWNMSYGPAPDFDIATFLLLNKALGSIPYITIPPAFNSEDFRTSVLPQITEMQKRDCDSTAAPLMPGLVDQLENSYQEHLEFLDYLAVKSGTIYGGKAAQQGFSDWSQQLSNIYFELGNELWNSMSKPYYMWDCVKMQDNYGNYSLNRMRAMKSNPAWKPNYKIGFNGQWGNWSGGWQPNPNSWDAIAGQYTKDYVDFYADAPYWPAYILPSGWCTPSNLPSDETIYSAMYATNDRFKQDVALQYNFIKSTIGKNVEHIWYEINVEMMCGGYQVRKKDNPLFFKHHSIGSAVAQLDNYLSFPMNNIAYANHYQDLSRDLYGAHLGYPDFGRRPEWFALQMLSKADSQILETAVTDSPTWSDPASGLTNLPYIHAYGYKEGEQYSVLVINRDRTNSHNLTINLPQRSYNSSAILSKLTSGNINDNNDNPDLNTYAINESVKLIDQSITDFANGYSLSIPPFSAYLLQLNRPAISLEKSVDKTTASSGDTLTYTISYTVGTQAVTNAILEDPIPNGTTFIAGSATNGGNSDGIKVIWNLGNLAPGTSGTVSFQVKIP